MSVDKRKPNPSHQILSRLNSLCLEMQGLTKALHSLADSNRELVKANAELLSMIVMNQEPPEEAPRMSYLDGKTIGR